jgi:hypothetical protein
VVDAADDVLVVVEVVEVVVVLAVVDCADVDDGVEVLLSTGNPPRGSPGGSVTTTDPGGMGTGGCPGSGGGSTLVVR